MSFEYDDNRRKNKRYVAISISSVLLISMVVAVTVGVNRKNEEGNDSNGEVTASVKAVKEVCAPTEYKKTCEDTLTKNSPNATDPIELVKTAFTTTILQLTKAAEKSQLMVELQKDPRTKMALDQCIEVTNYAIDELKTSFEEMGKFEFHKLDDLLVNLRIWLSAAISHEETCFEGFQGTQGDAGETMKKHLKTAVQLTHNALAIVCEMSKFLMDMNIPGLNNRRLLSQDVPSWVDGRARQLLATGSEVKADIVVAQDGSGQFKTINEAMQKVPKKQNSTFVIHIKEGVYKEYVHVNKSMSHLVFIGDGPQKTVISGDKNFKDGITTYRTATVAVVANYFMAKNIGFENTAGAVKHQAVAIRVQSDEAIFHNCRFDGYQDTLYAHSHRQFYRDCTISGTIDFVFGDAAAVFQNCTLLVRKPMANQACPITAHGRKDPRESTGFVFQGCRIEGEPDYMTVKDTSKTYLGRPWKEYSRTIIMNSFIPEFVQPEGWQPWAGNFGLDTLFYSEVENVGPGAPGEKRVTWKGIKKLSKEEIDEFLPAKYIQGDDWIPKKNVPYTGGILTATGSGSTETASGSGEAASGPSEAASGSGEAASGPSEAASAPSEAASAPSGTGSGGAETGSKGSESGSTGSAGSPAAAPAPSKESEGSESGTATPSASPSASPSAATSGSASPSASPSATPSGSSSATPSASPAAAPKASG